MAARFHEFIETIHPFANGNGRFGRIITEQICDNLQIRKPSWGVRFSQVPAERRRRYIDALIRARKELDYTLLADLMFS